MDTTTEDTQVLSPLPPEYFELEFRGSGLEYTKIILVNIVLSILTLGVFSAWAKVRAKKYLYGNTYLNGHNFNYHADPLKILMGRMIVGILFILYVYGGKISTVLSLGALGVFLLALPWMYVKSLSFNLSNTSYRNVRFGFQKKYQESYITFIKGYFLTLISFGICFPYFYQTLVKFRLENTRFGDSYFKSKFSVGDFFTVYFKIIGIYFLSAFAMMVLIGIGVLFFGRSTTLSFMYMGTYFLGLALLYGGILFAVAVGKAGFANLIHNNTMIDKINFRSSLNSKTLFVIYLKNILLGIVTLGLGIPYGMYRIIVYKLQSTSVVALSSDFDGFIASTSTDDTGAISDAAGDFWDFDIGF